MRVFYLTGLVWGQRSETASLAGGRGGGGGGEESPYNNNAMDNNAYDNNNYKSVTPPLAPPSHGRRGSTVEEMKDEITTLLTWLREHCPDITESSLEEYALIFHREKISSAVRHTSSTAYPRRPCPMMYL